MITSQRHFNGRSLHEEEPAGSEQAEEHEEEGFNQTKSGVVAVMILVLILLTIAFEEIKDYIEESATQSLKPIINSLFGEITVLGFLSLITFCVSRLGVFEILSVDLFGEEESEYLQELFESVHFALFFVMILFVVQVMQIVRESIKTEERFNDLNNVSKDEDYMKGLLELYRSGKARKDKQVLEQLEFYALRREFILERSVDPPFRPALPENRINRDFNFGRYLSIVIGSTVAHSVHLGIVTWSLMAAFDILFFAIVIAVKENMVVISWVWTLFGVLFMLYADYVYNDLQFIKSNLTSFAIFEASETEVSETQPLIGTSGDILPRWCYVDLEKYSQNRSFLLRSIDTTNRPNRQDALYSFGRQGPRLFKFFFQVSLLFTSINVCVLLFHMIPHMYENTSWATLFVYVVLSFIPCAVLLSQRRDLVASLVLVTSSGIHRKPQIVSSVERERNTAKVIKAFITVNQMLKKVNEGLFDKPIEYNEDLLSKISPAQTLKIGKVFDGFDNSGDGTISVDELSAVFKRLGAPLDDSTVEKIVKAIDLDGTGDISKDEFVKFYVSHIMPESSHEISMEERAHDLFQMFDTSGDGEITIGEMKSALDAFDFGFSVDEVGRLIQELDHNVDGSIGEEEFLHMLHAYESHLTVYVRKELPKY